MSEEKIGSWIRVKDRLPSKDGLYQVKLQSGYERAAIFEIGDGWTNIVNNSKVGYWFDETE